MHGAYHWKHVPPGGWTTVPGERIVWSRSDFDLVDPTSRAHLAGPGSLQTIAMLLSAEASLRHPRTAQARERLLADAEAGWREFAPDGRPRVLFMSQRATDTELLAKLVADKERRYFFRFHPRLAASSGTPELAALLSSVKADSSTNLPLPVVMAGVDLVLSYSSAGFLEGRYFGLPTVFLDDYARTIRFSYTGDDLIESSVERCGADIAGLNLRPSPALPMDRLMSMVAQLPDVKQLASELVG